MFSIEKTLKTSIPGHLVGSFLKKPICLDLSTFSLKLKNLSNFWSKMTALKMSFDQKKKE
jgi:hypothetical protein